VRNADTIQQRARFLGYKGAYLGYCRVFLEADVRDAYRDYVEHEEDVRQKLIEQRENGGSLAEWKRALVLTMRLRPTRANVLDVPYYQGQLSDDWFQTRAPIDPTETELSRDAVESNRRVAAAFVGARSFTEDVGDPRRTADERHLVASGVRLKEAYDELLTRLRVVDPGESQRFTALLVQVDRYLSENPDAICTVYQMTGGRTRVRGFRNGQIINLLQGRNPLQGPVIYPGDRLIRASSGLTLQIHRVDLRDPDSPATFFARDVPVIAAWVPSEMARGVLVQNQPGS
jgi:hypothetical protein